MSSRNNAETLCDRTSARPPKLHGAMLAAASPFLCASDFDEAPTVLPGGQSAFVVKRGLVVVKAHRSKTNSSELNARLELIGHAEFRDLFLQPLRSTAELGGARLLTLWPLGIAVMATTPQDVDWEGGARLLAALHRVSLSETFAGSVVPEAGWLSRLARSRSRLLATGNRSEKRMVLAAFATLPPFDATAWRPCRPSFVHGDWHPGQVVQLQGTARLIDIDDVGVGDPAWDLARPAAWRLAGFLSDAVWDRFLNSYREAGGHAIISGDPWATLELPARAAVIQSAASALVKAERDVRPLEDFEQELVNGCSRIVKIFS